MVCVGWGPCTRLDSHGQGGPLVVPARLREQRQSDVPSRRSGGPQNRTIQRFDESRKKDRVYEIIWVIAARFPLLFATTYPNRRHGVKWAWCVWGAAMAAACLAFLGSENHWPADL